MVEDAALRSQRHERLHRRTAGPEGRVVGLRAKMARRVCPDEGAPGACRGSAEDDLRGRQGGEEPRPGRRSVDGATPERLAGLGQAGPELIACAEVAGRSPSTCNAPAEAPLRD